MQAISILVPVFNEADAIRSTLAELLTLLSKPELTGEIIVINDGCTDGTDRVITEFAAVRVITHAENLGYGAALKSGLRSAIHSTVVITDADGTYPIEAIPRLIELLDSSSMVVGARTGANVNYSWVRKMPKVFLKAFSEWIAGRRIPDLNSGLRAFAREDAIRFERLLPDGFSFTTTLTLAMLTSNLPVHFVPIDYTQRIGKSKFRPIRDTWLFGITVLRLGVYFAPLKVFLPIASVFFGAGLWTLAGDIWIRQDITDRTVVLLITAMQVGLLALLADAISRRS